MKLKYHIAATVVVSGSLYLFFHSAAMFTSSLVTGIFIDLDHVIDYYRHTGINFRVRNFFEWCYNDHWDTLIIFLHSVELVLVLWVVTLSCKFNYILFGAAIGMSQHLVLDIIFNGYKVYVFSYFFTYRVLKAFKKEHIIRERC